MSLQQHELKRDNPALTDAMIARMIATAAAHCAKDGWTDLALNCYTDAKETKDVAACDLLLTKDQRRKLDADVMKATTSATEIADDHGCEAALASGGTRALEAALQKNWNAKFAKWMTDGIASVYLARCRRDRWSPVLLACLSTAKTEGDLAACPDLDATQQQRLDSALMPYYKNAMEEKAAK
jgi:hypothetical protein